MRREFDIFSPGFIPLGVEALPTGEKPTFRERLDDLVKTKLEHTRIKQQLAIVMDYDDHSIIPPPAEIREMVDATSGSGMPIKDVRIREEFFGIESNHPSGGFFGAEMVGRNFRRLLEKHPPYIDPESSLAGGYMVNFGSYRKVGWNPDIPVPPELAATRKKYKLDGAIGAGQHFCQDLYIGLELGWQGILEKIARYRQVNPEKAGFYNGLEDVVVGMKSWIGRNAQEAGRMALEEQNPQLKENLLQMAEINECLVNEPPRNFREACQWILWYDMAARMYNGSGSLGRLDVLLQPYYDREKAAATLSNEEAIFHLACLLLRDTAYIQLGGPDENGKDVTSQLSYLVLEAAHRLKIPANIGVCVGENVDPGLLARGVKIMVEDKTGIPKFLGSDNTIAGFIKNGYPPELARKRAYSGCHWSAIPGREYTLNDCVKINFGVVFDVAFREMMADLQTPPSTGKLWQYFENHLTTAVEGTAESIDFQLTHMAEVFPELVLDLLCYGPIEKGLDASAGGSSPATSGVEFYNLCVDGAALATVADSFAAIEQRVEKEKRLSWQELLDHLDNNWEGIEGERARLMMKNIDHRYGFGNSEADEWAVKISKTFTNLVKEKPTPNGFNMIPGLFSWAATIGMGKTLGATPNGRKEGEPISHGSNPDPGFRKDGAPTALAVAVASVQSGWGNTAPLQLDIDPSGISTDNEVVEKHLIDLITTHFKKGGTQINLNIIDKKQILAANKDPLNFPGLIVRVTGFSAYWVSLSPEFRQLVVNRIVSTN
ncbi:formate acetyltransferase [Candidatus Shapirobacteria bacterium CG09_land_8_20_14_0_10_39_12]|uniref:Formate acetyltransferase n=1 Tax=Candidatus Shapirobacteria bacterium CG09_land_8_20_14_0_10_39_12 TaxID=1974885 RepID=A0A2H0WS57_9BACT|nr:MAG: formate acetyltransferase [Candidatus Shapirobacteria bacterium CG09_land_8_20_14_0_10_39_12]